MNQRRIKGIVAAAIMISPFAFLGAPERGDAMLLTAANAGKGKKTYSFVIQGRPVSGIYPGKTKYINLRLKNPYGFTVRVTRVRGDIVRASRKGCLPGPQNLRTLAYTGRLPVRISPGGSVSGGTIPVSMPLTASRKCANTTFTIMLTGTAEKV